jgi:uncharacterized protein YciI
VIAVHVAVTTSEDYVARREPLRAAHVERLLALREAGAVIGGGPAPDGRSVDLFYRVARPDELTRLVEDDPYSLGGAWIRYASRTFSAFVEPWEAVPLVLDGSRRATIVEGPALEPDVAQLALIELRGAGRLAFGGVFDEADTLVVARSPDAAQAVGWLGETGLWQPQRLRARPFLHVL